MKTNEFHAIIYTREGCQPCKATKKRLEGYGASFEEVLIDDSNRDKLKEMGHQKAPVVLVYEVADDDKEFEASFAGYNVTKIDQYFKPKKDAFSYSDEYEKALSKFNQVSIEEGLKYIDRVNKDLRKQKGAEDDE